ncbi:MAG: hypothetical protein J0L55_13590 [Caulobacterales bacterium]|nr:hypothetical protein [Caulobacterales bacterium]
MASNLSHAEMNNDESFKSLGEQIFEQVFRANPDVSLNGLVRAAVKAAEESPHAMEQIAKKKDEDEELTAQMIEAGEATKESFEQAALRREREEWANSEHELNGVNLKGYEWADLAEAMRNDEKTKNAMIQHLMAQGLTKPQAEQKAKEFTDAAAAMGKLEKDRTPEDKAAIDKAKNDPKFKGTLEAAQTADSINIGVTSNNNALKSDTSISNIDGAESGLAILNARTNPNFNAAIDAAQNSMQFNVSMNAPIKSENKSNDGGIQSVVRPTPAFTFAANGGNVTNNAVTVGTNLQVDAKQNTQFSSLNQTPKGLTGAL